MSDVLIHPNTGDDVGLGHLVRCLTLSKELSSREVDVELLLKSGDDAVEFARDEGVDPRTTDSGELQQTISASPREVVVIDSYAFTSADFDRLSEEKTLIVIDELGDRRIPADLVINNNIYADDIEYPAADAVCRGPDYCMLRKQFRDLGTRKNHHPPESILVTVGGADIAGVFKDVLSVATEVANTASIDAVVGPYFSPPKNAPRNIVFHRAPPDIRDLMWKADLAVSGGGQTMYELAACGTPTVALTLGDDQVRNIAGMEEAGFCCAVGKPDQSNFPRNLQQQLERLCKSAKMRQKMGVQGQEIVDGYGVVRVADRVVEM